MEPRNTTEFIEHIKWRIRNDYDNLILLTGKEGSGKSTLAFKLGALIDPTFNHQRMVYSAEDMVKTAAKLRKGQVIVLDEAIEGGFSRRAMSKQNVGLSQFLFVCRERNLTVIVCFPNINYVDKIISEHRLHWWGLVGSRGKCVMHKPLPNDYPGSKSWKEPVFGLAYTSNEGNPEWDAYLQKKREMVGDRALIFSGADKDDQPSSVSDLKPTGRFLDVGAKIIDLRD